MGLLGAIFSPNIIKNIRISFRKIERELNEHLDSINANSNEVAYLYELNSKLEEQIDTLRDRIQKLEMSKRKDEIVIDPLTTKEKRVFICLYTNDEISYVEMSKKLNMSLMMVQEYVTNLTAKGIPVLKNYKGNLIHVSLERKFKDLQTKKRIVKLV